MLPRVLPTSLSALLACALAAVLATGASADPPRPPGAATAAAPIVLPAAATASPRGVVAVPLRNPGSHALAVTVRLRGAGTNVARKLRIAAGRKATVLLRLGRKLRGRLARGERLRVRISARVRPARGGRARTVSRRLTVARGSGPTPDRPGEAPEPPPAAPFDGTYGDSDGVTMVVQDGVVTSFSGDISTYCTVTRRQKTVAFSMAAADARPTVAADGGFAWEATSDYGFVKLKYEGRIAGGRAAGNLVVEDRSMIFGTGRIEFDYCFAGRDFTLERSADAAAAGPAPAATEAARRRRAAPRWRVAKVTLDGWSQHRDAYEDYTFEADGRVHYRTVGKPRSKPVALPPSRLAVPVTVEGLTWRAQSTARIVDGEDVWDCSHALPRQRAGLSGAFTVGRKRARVQWSLAPTYLRCPAGAPLPEFEGLPLAAATSTFPTRLLRGRVARIPVEIQHRWIDSAGSNEVHWDGIVVLRRTR
ncbi:MAG: hypothetical protein GXY03_09455 [Solirubrobacterales bacterium]|nr:hypothetical protein [Solirubrobacterales bacterium]